MLLFMVCEEVKRLLNNPCFIWHIKLKAILDLLQKKKKKKNKKTHSKTLIWLHPLKVPVNISGRSSKKENVNTHIL